MQIKKSKASNILYWCMNKDKIEQKELAKRIDQVPQQLNNRLRYSEDMKYGYVDNCLKALGYSIKIESTKVCLVSKKFYEGTKKRKVEGKYAFYDEKERIYKGHICDGEIIVTYAKGDTYLELCDKLNMYKL